MPFCPLPSRLPSRKGEEVVDHYLPKNLAEMSRGKAEESAVHWIPPIGEKGAGSGTTWNVDTPPTQAKERGEGNWTGEWREPVEGTKVYYSCI